MFFRRDRPPTLDSNNLALENLSTRRRAISSALQAYSAHLKSYLQHNFEFTKMGRVHPLNAQDLAYFIMTQELPGGYCFQSAYALHQKLTQLDFDVSFHLAISLVASKLIRPLLALPETHLLITVTLAMAVYPRSRTWRKRAINLFNATLLAFHRI